MERTAWLEGYEQYRAGDHWQGLRNKVLERCGGICERCRHKFADDVHHTPQAYRDLRHENPVDLQALCSDCHLYVSGRSSFDPAAPEPTCVDCGDPAQLLDEDENRSVGSAFGLATAPIDLENHFLNNSQDIQNPLPEYPKNIKKSLPNNRRHQKEPLLEYPQEMELASKPIKGSDSGVGSECLGRRGGLEHGNHSPN